MTAEITVMADKEDKMLTVQCSLVSEDLFSMDKFMQFDVQCKFITSMKLHIVSNQLKRHITTYQIK